ncbi:MAG TPA: hypothetical protein VFH47_00145 [Candidatus Thermoplasmatota archaeon]|nr:hypothetical protein [Candidatus Thermoplasmatota archaeon]
MRQGMGDRPDPQQQDPRREEPGQDDATPAGGGEAAGGHREWRLDRTPDASPEAAREADRLRNEREENYARKLRRSGAGRSP